MFSHWVIISLCSVVFLSAIGGLTLSAVAISHARKVIGYENQTCTSLVNTTIVQQSVGSYSCSGYTGLFSNTSTSTGNGIYNYVKLSYPIYDPLLYGVSEQACNDWITMYTNLTYYTCYVQNPSEKCTSGYVKLPVLTKFYVIIAISCFVIFAMFIIGIIMFARYINVNNRTRTSDREEDANNAREIKRNSTKTVA